MIWKSHIGDCFNCFTHGKYPAIQSDICKEFLGEKTNVKESFIQAVRMQ